MLGNVSNLRLSFEAKYEAERGEAPRSENVKLLFYQQPDMTDDNVVPCESVWPPENSTFD